MKCLKFLHILLLWAALCSGAAAQVRLVGTVKGANSEAIQAFVQLKGAFKNSFFQTSEEGKFHYTLDSCRRSVVLQIKAMGYSPYTDTLRLATCDTTVRLAVQLQTAAIDLEEVEIKTVRKVVVKKDTTVFDVQSFSNGSERKIEEIIKKLPGMEVNEDGRIKYLGKWVESVQLDGQDLFGGKYAIGTKNLPADLVGKIEAIDNFSANPMLKGLINSETVSLNLKLKKSNPTFMLDGNVGLGTKTLGSLRQDASLTGIALAGKLKSFAALTTNNVGLKYGGNNSMDIPLDNSKVDEISDGLTGYGKRAGLLTDDKPPTLTSSAVEVLNNEQTAAYNGLWAVSPKLSLKAGLTYETDKQRHFRSVIQDFTTQNVVYDDYTQGAIRSRGYAVSFSSLYLPNKKNYLTTQTDVSRSHLGRAITTTLNREQQVGSSITTSDVLFSNKLDYTHRLGDSSAIQFKSDMVTNAVPQTSSFQGWQPGNTLLPINGQRVGVYGLSTINRLLFYRQLSKLKLTTSVGHEWKQDSILATGIDNDLSGRQRQLLTSTTYFLRAAVQGKIKGIETFIGLAAEGLKQRLINNLNTPLTNQVHYLLPTLRLAYQPSVTHRLAVEASRNYDLASYAHQYATLIFQNPRQATVYQPSLQNPLHTKGLLSYRFADIFSLFTATASINYTGTRNVFLNTIQITPDYSVLTYFMSPRNTQQYIGTVGIEKFIPLLKLSAKYMGVYTHFNYFNQLAAEAAVRTNTAAIQNHSLFLRTGFSLPFTIENTTEFSRSEFRNAMAATGNVVLTAANKIAIIYKPTAHALLSVKQEAFMPDLKQKRVINFLHVEASYELPQSKKMPLHTIRLQVNNIFNANYVSVVETTDYVRLSTRNTIMGRYALLAFGFRL